MEKGLPCSHPVGPLAHSLYVGLVPLPRHAIDNLTVVHEIAGDVSASNEGWLLPGEHHGVLNTLQNGDAIGWSGRGWDRGLQVNTTPPQQRG